MNRGRKSPADIGVMLAVGAPKKKPASPMPFGESEPDAGESPAEENSEGMITCPSCGEKMMITVSPMASAETQPTEAESGGGGDDYGSQSVA